MSTNSAVVGRPHRIPESVEGCFTLLSGMGHLWASVRAPDMTATTNGQFMGTKADPEIGTARYSLHS